MTEKVSTELHRRYLIAEHGVVALTPRLEAELDFLELEEVLLSDDEFERRQAAGEPLGLAFE